MANAGQIKYKDINQVEQTLDVFHFKDGTVRVKKRGGPIGPAGDTVVFLNGNFVNDSIQNEFWGTATSEELVTESMLKQISDLVDASLDGLGGNSKGWNRPAWLDGGLEGKIFKAATVPNSTTQELKDYGGFDTFLGATGTPGADPKSAQYPIDALYYKDGSDNVAGGRTGSTLTDEAQDHLVISQYKYKVTRAKDLFKKNASLLTTGIERNSALDVFLGLVRLPMPNDITDSNNVKWGEDVMNAIEAAGIKTFENVSFTEALTLMGGGLVEGLAKAEGATGGAALGTILAQNGGGNFGNMADTYGAEITSRILAMAGIESSAASILARGKGVIPNSNLELLFQAPMLREFQFNYRLSPRSDAEARVVNHIVRFFKQGMAAKKQTAVSGTGASYFLGTPNVFRLQYRTSKNAAPAGINRIKTCALTGTSVNYTPEGAWAAYEGGQPVSIMLSMRFQELEPVYDTDYAPYDENDENIRNEDGNDLASRWSIKSAEVGY